MKTLQKYCLFELVKYFFPMSIFFITIFAISEFFWRLPDFLYYKPDTTVILQFLFLHTPLWFVQTLPLTTMLATLLTISSFNYYRELLAISTIGINLKKFFVSWIVIGIILSLFSFYLNDKLATKFFRKAQVVFYAKVKNQPYESNVIKDLFYYETNKEETNYLFIDIYDRETKKVHDFVLNKYKNGVIQQICAHEGVKQNLSIVLHNCIIRNFVNHKLVNEKIINNYVYPLPVDLEDFKYNYNTIQLDQLTIAELYRAIKILRYKNEPDYRVKTEISYRYAISVLNFIVMLLSISLGKNISTQGKLRCFIYSILIFIIYWMLLSFMKLLGETNIVNPYISVWIPNILFFIVGTFLYFKKEYYG